MTRAFAKHGRWTLLLIGLLAAGCGTPVVYGVGFMPSAVNNPTVTPLPATVMTVVAAPTATPTVANTTAAPKATATTMPGMDTMPTLAPVAAVTSNPNATEFVLDDVLYGTPSATAKLLNISALITATSRAGQWQVTMVGTPQPTATVAAQSPTVITPAVLPTAIAATSSAAPPKADAGGAIAGNAVSGKAIFNGSSGCNACHDVANGVTLVGPSLKGIAGRAAARKAGMTTVDYLHESIVSPNAYIVSGFTASIMPQTFAQTLTKPQIDDLVAYLLTLK